MFEASNATFGLIFQLLGSLPFLVLVWIMVRQLRARNWEQTNGLVMESYVRKDADMNDEPYVRYRYKVGGKIYENDKIYLTGSIATIPGYRVSRLVSQAKPGSVVAVYYDPDNPAESALELRLPGWVYALLVIAGVVFIVFGAYFRQMR
jgi:hypothetical protein